MFFEMKDIICDFSTKAQNTEWISDFAFATDIMQKMNELNKELQGKGVFAHDLYLEFKSFPTKLTLFEKQMSNENFAHFPLLKTQSVNAASAQRYSGHITGLRKFARRFVEFNAMEHEFDLLKSPFSYDTETVADELQMELIDLQAYNALKSSFGKKPLIEFYESLQPEKLKNVKEFARKMFVLFASTYIWEQTFSSMKISKSKNRSLLTDSNLQAVLRISTSSFEPDLNKLVDACCRLHRSH